MRCWVFSLDALPVCVLSSSSRANLATDFHQSVVRAAQRSRLLLVPVSVQPPFPTVSPHSTLTAPTTQGAQIRSFTRSGTDRPFRPICSKPPADFQMLRSLPNNLPCDQHTIVPTGYCFETSLSRASLLDARLPAVHLQRLGWSLVSAAIFNLWLQLCASTYRLPPHGHTRTPQGHTGLPQSGCSHRALATMCSHAQTQATETGVKELLQNNSDGNNI